MHKKKVLLTLSRGCEIVIFGIANDRAKTIKVIRRNSVFLFADEGLGEVVQVVGYLCTTVVSVITSTVPLWHSDFAMWSASFRCVFKF